MLQTADNNRCNVKALCKQIKTLSQPEIDALDERSTVFSTAFNCLLGRIKNLPMRQCNATLSLFYRKMLDTLLEFHLTVARSDSEAKMADLMRNGTITPGAVSGLLAEYQVALDELEQLYSCK